MVDMPLLEYASMSFLRERIGLDVPETQLDILARDRYVFGAKRFDRDVDSPIHSIFANSLFNVDKIKAIRDSRKTPIPTLISQPSYANFRLVMNRIAASFLCECWPI